MFEKHTWAHPGASLIEYHNSAPVRLVTIRKVYKSGNFVLDGDSENKQWIACPTRGHRRGQMYSLVRPATQENLNEWELHKKVQSDLALVREGIDFLERTRASLRVPASPELTQVLHALRHLIQTEDTSSHA